MRCPINRNAHNSEEKVTDSLQIREALSLSLFPTTIHTKASPCYALQASRRWLRLARSEGVYALSASASNIIRAPNQIDIRLKRADTSGIESTCSPLSLSPVATAAEDRLSPAHRRSTRPVGPLTSCVGALSAARLRGGLERSLTGIRRVGLHVRLLIVVVRI